MLYFLYSIIINPGALVWSQLSTLILPSLFFLFFKSDLELMRIGRGDVAQQWRSMNPYLLSLNESGVKKSSVETICSLQSHRSHQSLLHEAVAARTPSILQYYCTGPTIAIYFDSPSPPHIYFRQQEK